MTRRRTHREEVERRRAGSLSLSGRLATAVGILLLAWVANVSRIGLRVEGCPQACSTSVGRQDDTLRVMSLNVLHGYPTFAHLQQRLQLIAREIRRYDADIICLQEVPWTWHLGSGAKYLSEQTGLNYLYARANGNRYAIFFEEGVVILSRYTLHAPQLIELKPQAGVFEHRVALYATAMTPWGTIRVFVTHLTHGDPTINRAQITALRAFVEQSGIGPAIIAGDLNATENVSQIQALAPEWIDGYRATNPNDPGLTCCIKDLAESVSVVLKKRIDYIFLAAHTGLQARILATQRVFDHPFHLPHGWQWASDHVGLLTVIRLEPRQARAG